MILISRHINSQFCTFNLQFAKSVVVSDLFCELDEVSPLGHDVPWEVLADHDAAPAQRLGLLQHGSPVLQHNVSHMMHHHLRCVTYGLFLEGHDNGLHPLGIFFLAPDNLDEGHVPRYGELRADHLKWRTIDKM